MARKLRGQRGWNRPLARALRLVDGRELRTLHDARAFFLDLGEAVQRTEWRHAAMAIIEAEKAGTADAIAEATDTLDRWLLTNGRLRVS